MKYFVLILSFFLANGIGAEGPAQATIFLSVELQPADEFTVTTDGANSCAWFPETGIKASESRQTCGEYQLEYSGLYTDSPRLIVKAI